MKLKSRLVWLLCVMFLLLFGGNMSYAQTHAGDDCNETSNYSEDGYVQKVKEVLSKNSEIKELKIFTDKDLKTALRYHQQYCCEDRVQETKCTGKLDGKKYYPESPYLFDHLITVGMRKFDGVQKNCDILGIDCQTADGKKQLVERRESVKELALETDGNPPSQLFELFKKYWGDPSAIDSGTKNVGEDKDKMANAYMEMCREAVAIREAVTINTEAVDLKSTSGAGLFNSCVRLVKERYVQEAAFVQTLMVEKGVKYMSTNIKKYVQDYFIVNRMSDLVDKFGKLDACFNMVLRYVTRTACCVH